MSIITMYIFAALVACFKWQQAWVAAAFAVAGVGMFASASTANPVYGFVAPAAFGLLKQRTGSIQDVLYGLATASLLGAVAVFFARNRPKKGAPEAAATVPG